MVNAMIALMLIVLSSVASAQDKPIFTSLKPEESGVKFLKKYTDVKISADSMMRINGIVPTGGSAIGDITGDGRPDLIFSNFGGCAFFRNEGNLRFTDITDSVGVRQDSLYLSGGLNLVDIDADGDLDVFVARWQNTCRLLINDGKGHFTEESAAYGLDYKDETVNSVFFDYDKDGFLDCYLVTYSNWYSMMMAPKKPDSVLLEEAFRRQVDRSTAARYGDVEPTIREDLLTILDKSQTEERHSGRSDRLYRNLGNGRFEEASSSTWIGDRGMGLSATVADINLDGWPDIYVANDFNMTDMIYVNNGDGSFAENFKNMTRRASIYSMGSDVADLNADGLPDIVTTDMLPRTHKRRVLNGAMHGDLSIHNPMYDSNQVVRNMVQLNKGYNQFSDIGFLTDMAATDWSWACLMADFDLDGQVDVFIANGYMSDISNQDYVNNVDRMNLDKLPSIPPLSEPNAMFHQIAPLRFEEVAEKWGMGDTSVSFGAAYGDLDDDGDLDLIVANFDSHPHVYRNNSRELGKGSYIGIRFVGSSPNTAGLGAKIRVVADGKRYYRENYVIRGFQSRMDDKIVVGLGNATVIDSLIVEWPDATTQVITDFSVDTTIVLRQADAQVSRRSYFRIGPADTTLFVDVTKTSGLSFNHYENYFDDFKHYRLMPTRVSWGGPTVAVADINDDGLEDVVFGHSKGRSTSCFVQGPAGKFRPFATGIEATDTTFETQAMLLVDIDGDSDRDLICAGGGAEYDVDAPERQVCVYINDGKGLLAKSDGTRISASTNATTLNAADIDRDGDVDLFIGAGVATDAYPYCDRSFLLLNNGNGVFTDATDSLAPGLKYAGLIRSALWTDYNNDDKVDLVLVGEWMPLTVFRNTGKGWVNSTSQCGLDSSTGWWYSVMGADIDNDGDVDYVCGNFGENSRYLPRENAPIEVYAADYDDNGSVDAMITYYVNGKQKLIHDRPRLLSQMPTLNRKLNTYEDFARAEFRNVFESSNLDTCFHRSVYSMKSAVYVNNGNGTFSVKPLPIEAQVSPVLGIEALDLNDDDYLDLVLTGNMYGAEGEVVRYDAGKGLVLYGSSTGDFRPLTLFESGFISQFDTRGLVAVKNVADTANPIVLVSAVNQRNAMTYVPNGRVSSRLRVIPVDPVKTPRLDVKLGNSTRKVEVYCGSGYRSQTSCNITVPKRAQIRSLPKARRANNVNTMRKKKGE